MANRLAFQTQLASIMEVLANAAVAEICKLVDDDYAVVSLQMSQCQRENKALKRKNNLLELKMARGYAERRLRESALSAAAGGHQRPRVSLHASAAADRFRDNSPSTDGGLHRQINMGLWPGGSTTVAVTSASIQRKSPDVQLVEPDLVKVEKVEGGLLGDAEMVEVPLIGEDGLVECGPLGAGGHGRPSLQKQDNPAASSQNQPSASLPETTQLSRAKHSSRGGNNNRGVESTAVQDEDADLVLVKVEEMEGVTEEQSSLRIQEVESSTDDYRAVLPFEDDAQNPTNRLSDLQESGQSFSEVSYGHSSLWTNGGDDSYCHDNSMPGPSSHRAPLSYPPSTLLVVEPGGSGRGLACSAGGGLAADGGDGFQSASSSSASFEQAGVIDLSDESSPVRVEGQTQVGPSERFLSQRQGQSGFASGTGAAAAKGKQKVPRKRECICPFCGKGFGSPANLESHLRTHTGERPYGCNICGKKFTQFWNLKIHRNIHTGERPYQCPICPERFSDPSNLKGHQKRHHTDGSQT